MSALKDQETADAHAGLADAAWWLNDEATVFEARERALHLYLSDGDLLGAGRMATSLFVDSIEFRGETAVANGWLQRAKQLLEGQEGTAEFAWLSLWEGSHALAAEADPEKALHLAARVSKIGAGLNDADLQTIGLALEGLALVNEGQVNVGLTRLDQAAAATMTGDVVDPQARGSTMCWLIGACDHARDYERAEQWSTRYKEVEDSWRVDGMFAVCRPHYALVLLQRGAWGDAEQQLEEGIRILNGFRPPMALESMVRLAELRWRQGHDEQARELFALSEADKLSLIGRAQVALDSGEPATALDFLDRYLRQVPSANRLERVPGLELITAAAVATDDIDRATGALDELQEIAEYVGTDPISAAYSVAKGRVLAHREDHEDARVALEDAVDAYGRHGASFDGARARVELAKVLVKLGKAPQAAHEAEAAIATLTPMGAHRDVQRATDVLATTASSAGGSLGQAQGLTPREVEVLSQLASGHSNQQIAETLVLSLRTVERHISNIYSKIEASGPTARAAATAFAYQHRLAPSS